MPTSKVPRKNSTSANPPLSVEKLSEIIEKMSIGIDRDLNLLRTGTRRIPIHTIPWSEIQHLHIIGKENPSCNFILAIADFHHGAYINPAGNWLLLLHPKEYYLQAFLDQFTDKLKALCIYNTALPTLDLRLLPSLQHLVLWQNALLKEISGFEQLVQLTRLHLFECDSLTDLPTLSRCSKLTTLRLIDCDSITELHGLEKLTNLTSLILLGSKQLYALPHLASLKKLSVLNLSGCSRLTGIPDLHKLVSLTELDCESSGIIFGENQKFPAKLRRLDLSETPNALIPGSIRQLRSLRWLGLNSLILAKVPAWLPEIAEKFCLEQYNHLLGENKAVVSLYNTTVLEKNFDMSIFQRPYEIVAEWFESRNKVPLDEIKVVFLGDGEAGKSHTIARLMNKGGAPVDYVNVRTPGIVIKDISYPVNNRKATLHLWDFGGQDILHSMHRIFLTERTFYVVVVDGSIGNQDERARYWLQNIQSFAKDAPVVLVLNKLDDDLQADVNSVDLHDKYKGLKKIVKLSALQYSPERFNREFTDVLLDEIGKSGFLEREWLQKWVQVKQILEKMDSNYIHGGDYLKICREFHVDRNQEEMLQMFHELGISFCYRDAENKALEDYVVLKPNWITNALYIILFNEREGGNGGLVPIRTIRNMLSWDAPNRDAIKRVIPDAYYAGYDVNYVLDVFHAFKLSFRKDDHHEFFPMLADINAKSVAREYADDADCLEFNMEFDYLPNNLLHRLMVERHSELDMNNVWRTGARFELPELGLSAVVVIDGNTLRFFIRNTDPMHKSNTYLAMLKANVDRIVKKMGIKAPECKLVYKLEGKQDSFDYEMLKAMLEAGQTQVFSMTWRKMLPIADVLNQSAPEGLEDEQKLLGAIHKSCLNIQGDMRYRGSEEDDRNTRIRDDLRYIGYVVHDQTRQGTTESGKRAGELDLEIRRENGLPWTIVESLRISNGAKTNWNKHLDKLVDSYNAHGLRTLFLIAFADCDKDRFKSIWNGYKDDHIQGHDSGRFTFVENSFREIGDKSANHLKVATCDYDCGGNRYHVYHIFVQMDPKPEAE